MSPVRYELGFYIQEDDIVHSNRCGNLKFLKCKCNYIPAETNFRRNFRKGFWS
jgi:hypothetical protein